MYVVCHSFANVKIRHFSFPSIKPSPRQERAVGHFSSVGKINYTTKERRILT